MIIVRSSHALLMNSKTTNCLGLTPLCSPWLHQYGGTACRLSLLSGPKALKVSCHVVVEDISLIT